MTTATLVVISAAILVVQMLNGYVLCETKLYTPGFTYWLISGITMSGILGAIAWRIFA